MTNTDQESILTKVEALLAKAESSDHEAERDAFINGAQRLMTKYAIDEAMLRQANDVADVVVEHIIINLDEIKYSKAVMQLIWGISNANNCKAIATHKNGKQRGFAFCTVFGSPAMLELVGMLVTSLHKQMELAIRNADIPEHIHGKTFKNNFCRAFAATITERLQSAKAETLRGETKSAELVLVDEAKRADEKMREEFPDVVTRGDSFRPNADGYGQGRQAGMNASLSRGEING